MVKTVRFIAGRRTALVVLGWIVYLLGLLLGNSVIAIPLLAIARVLP